MISSPNFIKATEKYNTFEESIPAYYFRKVFSSPQEGNATITVAVCGFYELYFRFVKRKHHRHLLLFIFSGSRYHSDTSFIPSQKHCNQITDR